MFGGFKSLSANFTPTPNQFFDEVVGFYPCRVVAIVGILIRGTLGWEDPDTGDRRVEAELPLSAFLRPDLSESSARRGLAEAIAAGLIVRTAAANSREGARYALRWADGEAQARAIEKARRAVADPLLGDPERGLQLEANGTEGRGVLLTPLEEKGRGVKLRGVKSTPPYKERKNQRKESKNQELTLNVSEDKFSAVSREAPPAPTATEGRSATSRPKARNAKAEGLNRLVAGLVAELQDLGSERRHQQLLSICEQHGLDDLAHQALQATRRRMAAEGEQGPLEKPGAYYQRVLVALLEEHQVFVPTLAEKAKDDPAEVRRLLWASLGMGMDVTEEN